MNGEKGNDHTIHLPAAPVFAIVILAIVMAMSCVIVLVVLAIRSAM